VKPWAITPRQLEILQHAMGMDRYGRRGRGSERNHYCAGGDDVADCAELVAIGYMRSFRREWLPYFNCVVTKDGWEAVRRESPVPPRLTRSQKRYRRWLEVADACNCTFGEWLRGNCLLM